jgi:D-hexose-6-phosphate mutarotase
MTCSTQPLPPGPERWPQFGPGDIQVHGFARNVDWALTNTTDGPNPSIEMTLTPSDYTKAIWDKDFKARPHAGYRDTESKALSCAMYCDVIGCNNVPI